MSWRRVPAQTEVLWSASGVVKCATAIRVQWRHPDDFWANYNLATLLSKLPHPKLEEAIRYLMMAVALRPLSPVVHMNLGSALWDKGDKDQGIAELRGAIRTKNDFRRAAHRPARGVVDPLSA